MSAFKSCCDDAIRGRPCDCGGRDSDETGDEGARWMRQANGDLTHLAANASGPFVGPTDDELLFFTSGQLRAIRGCNIETTNDGGRYSECRMSQAIAKLGDHLEPVEVEREEDPTTQLFQKYRVRKEKALLFFSGPIWDFDVSTLGHKSAPSEEEILLNVEVLRRSHCAVKKGLFNRTCRTTGLHLVFVTWWNYALVRILDLDLSDDAHGRRLDEFAVMKIMSSLLNFLTKDLGDVLQPGIFLEFGNRLGVDWSENVKRARRVMDHCDVLDCECSAAEAHIEFLWSCASQAKRQPSTRAIPGMMAGSAAVAKTTMPAAHDAGTLPSDSISTLYYAAPIAKPLPPGIADGSDPAASDSVCCPLTYANDFQGMISGKCDQCFGQLVAKDRGSIALPAKVPVRLKACGHTFHLCCLQEVMKQRQPSCRCPVCHLALVPRKDAMAFLRGNMPGGQISCTRDSISCAGYEGHGSVIITYTIHSSYQRSYHPHPGRCHGAASMQAYLPDNQEGHELLARLQMAFQCGLTATVSINDHIVWVIHHKTSPDGGASWNGYPDMKYLSNCNAQLDAMGVPSFKSRFASIRKHCPPNAEEREPRTPVRAPSVSQKRPPETPLRARQKDQPGDIFYEEKLQSVFAMVEGSKTCHLSSIMELVGSAKFVEFVERSGIEDVAVQLNPHVQGSEMYQDFIEEGIQLIGNDNYHVRIVFHGTPEYNIESILRNGLDPNLRKRQAFGQGEYFARSPALPVNYCCGGRKMLVFAVITSEADNRTHDIVVVEQRRRQLPIATLSFRTLNPSLLGRAISFQAQVSALWKEKLQKEKLAKESKQKEEIIRRILQSEYESASHIYKRACDDDGKPLDSWAEEVAMYVRDHVRDDTFVDFYFPNLPPRPINSRTVQTLNHKKCEEDAEKARQAYEKSAKGGKNTGTSSTSKWRFGRGK